MDLMSYLLGKKSSGGGGGGGSIADYIITNITENTSGTNFGRKMMYKTPPVTVDRSVTSLYQAFGECNAKIIDVSQLDTSNITAIAYMFSTCTFLEEIIGLNNLDVSQVTPIEGFHSLFSSCGQLKKVDISKWNIAKYTANFDFRSMFDNCYKIAVLDISSIPDDIATSNRTNNMLRLVGYYATVEDGAYASGIPYVYVKNQTVQEWILGGGGGAPNTWTSANVIVKE